MAEDYEIQPGDCVLSIAEERGFLWKTLWKHPKNQGLADKRRDPNVIMAGDMLHIPDRELKEESGRTEKRHTFRIKGSKARLRLKLTHSVVDDTKVEHSAAAMGEFIEPSRPKPAVAAEAGVPYLLYVDGTMIAKGETDQEGMIDEILPPDSKEGRLVLHPGKEAGERVIELNLGHMDPIGEAAGVCKRLNNLGYACPEDAGEESGELAGAVKAFQRDHDLSVSGNADDATRAKLKEIHGG